MDFILFSTTAIFTVYLAKAKQHTDNNNETKLCLQRKKALENGTSLNADERVCLVSEDNVPIETGGRRADMRLHNLWHRATYVLIRHVNDEENGTTYVLVQKRSSLKDYCPGKLDSAPGGVVGFGESYRENAIRELREEMGIVVSVDSNNNNSLRRLFTFSYQDERVRVWGDFYECIYRGSLDDLKLQEEEVEDILRMSLEELKTRIEMLPDDFLPDSCYAMRLYFQRTTDLSINRKLLKGYSSGDLDAYGMRPKPNVVFFDCDDCLYFDNWTVAKHLTAKIDEWCVNHGLKSGQAYHLYKKHGTALRGLLAEGYLEQSEAAIDEYLRAVHDIPVETLIPRDEELRAILLRMDPSIPKYIFTASAKHHAVRCLEALGIQDLFDGIIDCKSCDLETKHSKHAFQVAMQTAGVKDPERCVFLDDSPKNIQAARSVGWRSVLVGRVGRDCGTTISSEHAELEIDRIHDFPNVLPELF